MVVHAVIMKRIKSSKYVCGGHVVPHAVPLYYYTSAWLRPKLQSVIWMAQVLQPDAELAIEQSAKAAFLLLLL